MAAGNARSGPLAQGRVRTRGRVWWPVQKNRHPPPNLGAGLLPLGRPDAAMRGFARPALCSRLHKGVPMTRPPLTGGGRTGLLLLWLLWLLLLLLLLFVCVCVCLFVCLFFFLSTAPLSTGLGGLSLLRPKLSKQQVGPCQCTARQDALSQPSRPGELTLRHAVGGARPSSSQPQLRAFAK